MSFFIVMKYKYVIKIYVDSVNVFQYILNIPLKTLSTVAKSHRHLTKLECSPGREDGRLMSVILMDVDGVVGFKDVKLGEEFGPFDGL